MSLSNYVHLCEQLNAQRCHVTERLKITSNTKSLRVQPTSAGELRSIIEQELEQQGPDADLNFIDTSEITDMTGLFKWLDIRNIKIDEWNTSKVTTMQGMFAGCENFKGEGLENWDVSNVTKMVYMFDGCIKFVGNLDGWNTSKVDDMYGMFSGCRKFKGKGLENWDTSKVDDMRYMFHNCKKFNAPISSWDVSSVTNMDGMFLGCWQFKQDLSGWNVARVNLHQNFFGKKNIMPENFKPTL